jgi:hypothetical protein
VHSRSIIEFVKFTSTLCLCVLVLNTFLPLSGHAVDTNYNPVLKNPVYASGTGPIVGIDEAHNNNIADGRWIPLQTLLRNDGYDVQIFSKKFAPETLKGVNILIIANALADENKTNRALPTLPAFQKTEIDSLEAWVKGGGSLFLLAGHMPWPGAAEKLAERFGVFFQNGFAFAQDPETEKLVMSRDSDLKGLTRCSLLQHPIISGRSTQETISIIETGGMANAFRLRVGGEVRPIMLLKGEWILLFPQRPFEFSETTPRIRADEMPVAATVTPGKGRVVFFGINAAAFTAERFNHANAPYGINDPKVQNAQLVLNTFHWLSRVLPAD